MSNTERDKLILLLAGENSDRGGGPVFGTRALHPNQARAIADAILAKFMPEHDRKVAGRGWDEGHAVGGAEMRMLLLDPPLKPIPNPYSRRES